VWFAKEQQPGSVNGGFAPRSEVANGYGEHSPGGYSLLSALVTEVVMNMMFLLVAVMKRISLKVIIKMLHETSCVTGG
jgi:glycerol uptake facilitator-like aquaporin